MTNMQKTNDKLTNRGAIQKAIKIRIK